MQWLVSGLLHRGGRLGSGKSSWTKWDTSSKSLFLVPLRGNLNCCMVNRDNSINPLHLKSCDQPYMHVRRAVFFWALETSVMYSHRWWFSSIFGCGLSADTMVSIHTNDHLESEPPMCTFSLKHCVASAAGLSWQGASWHNAAEVKARNVGHLSLLPVMARF